METNTVKRYEFVKVENKKLGLKYPWMLLCGDILTLVEHTEKYMKTQIEDGIKDLFKNPQYHASTYWRKATETLSTIREETFLVASTRLENDIFRGKLKVLKNFQNILLRENGSYMVLTDGFVVVDKIVNNKMTYPNYTKEDIKITKWDGGTHYYAKIGNLTVIDKDGNEKWNSYKEAETHALNELNNLMS